MNRLHDEERYRKEGLAFLQRTGLIQHENAKLTIRKEKIEMSQEQKGVRVG